MMRMMHMMQMMQMQVNARWNMVENDETCIYCDHRTRRWEPGIIRSIGDVQTNWHQIARTLGELVTYRAISAQTCSRHHKEHSQEYEGIVGTLLFAKVLVALTQ